MTTSATASAGAGADAPSPASGRFPPAAGLLAIHGTSRTEARARRGLAIAALLALAGTGFATPRWVLDAVQTQPARFCTETCAATPANALRSPSHRETGAQ